MSSQSGIGHGIPFMSNARSLILEIFKAIVNSYSSRTRRI